MRKIISLICLLLPVLACADQLQIRPDAPDRYVVVKGDTLWDISGKFFKDPWKWPHIWGLNKDTVKDPHWIYPGDVINLDRANGTLRIGQAEESKPQAPMTGAPVAPRAGSESIETGSIRLSPKVHEVQSTHDAIPSIPARIIGPFLSQPLVVEEDELEGAPRLVGAREGRVVLGTNDIGFVKGMPSDKGDKWQIYRPGKKFVDPESDEVLGYEAVYLGNAEVTAFADVSTISITHAVQEAYQGDLLVAPSNAWTDPYLPRAPETSISASVISVYGGVSQAGQNAAIVLNKGARDGLEIGHVLALYRKGEVIKEKSRTFFGWDKNHTLPDERYGVVFVFRVFDKVSYGLVMQTKLPVQLLDRAQTP
jgi:nucleoid-associated protein YgaU